MVRAYEKLLWLYPAEHQRVWRGDVRRVRRDARSDGRAGPVARAAFFIREFAGLVSGAAREHLRGFRMFHMGGLLSTRRFNMRNGFRFPKATAVLMTIILMGLIVAIRKGEAIANSLPHVNPQIGPIAAGHSTLLPPIALFFAFFWLLGLAGWAVLLRCGDPAYIDWMISRDSRSSAATRRKIL